MIKINCIVKKIWFVLGNMWVISAIISAMVILYCVGINHVVYIKEPDEWVLIIEMLGMLIALIYVLIEIPKKMEGL